MTADQIDRASLDHSLGPFADSLDLTVLTANAEQVRADWTVTDQMLQPYGLLHGGVHCAVVETLASVAAAVWLGDRGRVVGVSNTTDFFRISRPGDRLSSTAHPVYRGRSHQVWRVETTDDAGQLVAQGQVRIHNLAPAQVQPPGGAS